MKFEFVDFYPKRIPGNKRYRGTCQVYFIDIQMDLRGIQVQKVGAKLYFRIPRGFAHDQETGKEVMYPIIGFTDEKITTSLFEFLQQEASPIIWEKLKELAKSGQSGES